MDLANHVAEQLEAAVAKKGNDEAYVRAVLSALIMAKVYVLLDRPWDGTSAPGNEARILHVSDGADQKQAMLAVFTSQQAYAEIMKVPGNVFTHPVLMDATRAILSVANGVGIYIDPNSPAGSFRIGAPAAWKLHEATVNQISI